MGQKLSRAVAPALEELQRRFEAWRSTGRKGRRIPEELWKSATGLAQEYGVNCVARTLGLDYVSVKRRLSSSDLPQAKSSPTEVGINRASLAAGAAFVELAVDPMGRIPQCVVEFEGVRGKFTLRLGGHNAVDIVALAEALSRPGR
jgi:hypothetical protein